VSGSATPKPAMWWLNHPIGQNGDGGQNLIFFNFFFIFKFKFFYFLIEYMTRVEGIIGIFRQKVPFWHSLVGSGFILVHLEV